MWMFCVHVHSPTIAKIFKNFDTFGIIESNYRTNRRITFYCEKVIKVSASPDRL